jgi:uncharacterized 2Fe-2S/4Fe-4S cluster protein (DUF4445 family)
MNRVSRKRTFGVALDIGTTDIKGSLLDIPAKRELARAGVPNEQRAFGQDVVTRLHLAARKEGLKELNKRVILAVNKLLKKLIGHSLIDKRDIKKIIAAGNSTMYHLMLMINPDTLIKPPFLSVAKKFQERNAYEMGIDVGRDVILRFLPNIAGFVGSDILAAILETRMHKRRGYNLIVDMGTNGEIALGSKNRIFVTSCASGPAFEARHIRCGMSAREGAIIRAKISNGRLHFKTVGNISPKGISGSGLIDVISILLNKDIIDRTGKMKRREYVIYKNRNKKIYLIPKDVREIQLAKAALAAGIEILRRRAKIELGDLNIFYITGTFGEGIDKKGARDIGLIPKGVSLNKIRFLKDGALSGTKKFLLDEASCKKEINSILARCEHVELHRDRDFEEVFAGSMHF